MHIGSKEEYINIIELDRNTIESPCAGDINIKVDVKLQKFEGSYDGIWLELSEINRFLLELKHFDSSRTGTAKISSISPDEFQLEIHASDNIGHMEIKIQLHRYQFSGNKYMPIFLMGGFDIEPSSIQEIISIFTSFTD
nr:hypothetical protein [uncultured Tolumonas sp.]